MNEPDGPEQRQAELDEYYENRMAEHEQRERDADDLDEVLIDIARSRINGTVTR